MKSILYTLLFSMLFLSACEENMPEIACLTCGNDTVILEPQDRVVLIEEFTGVRCVNCPQGSAEIKNLLSIHGERLVAVSIHAGFFAEKYPQSQYDFSTTEGDALENFLGLPEGYPTGVINRKLFSSESDLQLEGASSWAGYIFQELEEEAVVSLDVENTWNETNRQLTVDVGGGAFDEIPEQVRLTVFITESKIIDPQLTPEGIKNDYEHNHVLRKTLTAFDGDVIAASMNSGDLIDESFVYTLPNDWVVENCNVIAFVHLSDSGKLVLQATEKHIID